MSERTDTNLALRWFSAVMLAVVPGVIIALLTFTSGYVWDISHKVNGIVLKENFFAEKINQLDRDSESLKADLFRIEKELIAVKARLR